MGGFLFWLCGCKHPSLGCDIPANVRRHVFWHQHHGKFHRIGNAFNRRQTGITLAAFNFRQMSKQPSSRGRNSHKTAKAFAARAQLPQIPGPDSVGAAPSLRMACASKHVGKLDMSARKEQGEPVDKVDGNFPYYYLASLSEFTMPHIHQVATMTSKGQITLPKPIRQALGVDAGGA